ncbi:MAG: diaminopimelate decarboxylase [Chloroflexi bacterium]|nr:diaminopimelate decarboxylase [Chloroflexota bacterium]MDA1227155.1 diaminopimelate decarboxylase [Chloroflexota bacterium]
MTFNNIDLFPFTTSVNEDDHLTIGGCDVAQLAAEFGTPLYIYDDATLRGMCREFISEFTSRYPGARVAYASKAFVNPAIARVVAEEGMSLDIVSGGELAVAKTVDFPADRIYFHGNNKTPEELEFALEYGVGQIVVDSFHELTTLDAIAGSRGQRQDIMLRLSPSVDPHTHVATTTGILDSKFGFSVETGDAAKAIRQAIKATNLDLVGIHFHLGSPIFELEPYAQGIEVILNFLAQFKEEGLQLREFSPGGGFAIGYVRDELPPPIADYAEVIASTTKRFCEELGFDQPRLIVEPGRSIVGRAGVALYTVGGIKDIPTVRKYVSLDGGMGDNIRPAIYGSEYEAVLANRMSAVPEEVVTLAGKYCESGDVLVRDVKLPTIQSGDLIAIPSSGAYAPSMASNYNLNARPAMVIVKDGEAKLIRRRETFEDMMRADVF